MMEPVLLIVVREEDKPMMDSIIRDAEQSYFEETGEHTTLKLDPKRTLNKASHGGVILRDKKNRIKLDNTLNNRMDHVVMRLMPEIRVLLFGTNPNRRF